MGADFYFRMGATHAICQDYALAGAKGGIPYAMLSDGCSGSPISGEPGSPYTDFGSRFLVRAARWYLESLKGGAFPGHSILEDAQDMARAAGLPEVALDATLLTAVGNSNGVQTFQTGDGIVACRDRNGTIRYEALQFGNNAPFYLNYLSTRSRLQSFMCPRKDDPPEVVEAQATLEVTRGEYRRAEGWNSPVVERFKLDETSPVARRRTFRREETEIVLLLSDGAESFHLKDGTTVPLEQVLEQIFAIKGFVGEFLVRRCTKFLQKFCTERGWVHDDDFSVAGIYL